LSRVAVFYDWQNCYQQARVAFGLKQEPNERGVFDPFELARILAFGNRRGDDGDLVRVEIHRGLPSSGRDPRGNSAVLRQRDAWHALSPLVKVRLRPLRYNPETGEPQEKGIDVALAISVIEHVFSEFCDVAIIFSHDTDLLPVVETVQRLRGAHRIETASWKSDENDYHKRIPQVPGVINHTLRQVVFNRIETPINYAREDAGEG
jgi:uncharacterized LabA/DUF88 family protein